ncbi:hypothetical protein DFH29DRAFT_423586 [Suillus ampliporus]|nr:hypothetical protein DFH29DRAFT_423586 [Suillus ampliporus]
MGLNLVACTVRSWIPGSSTEPTVPSKTEAKHAESRSRRSQDDMAGRKRTSHEQEMPVSKMRAYPTEEQTQARVRDTVPEQRMDGTGFSRSRRTSSHHRVSQTTASHSQAIKQEVVSGSSRPQDLQPSRHKYTTSTPLLVWVFEAPKNTRGASIRAIRRTSIVIIF